MSPRRGRSETSRPVALVTGGSRGIGAAITARLMEEGYVVYVNYFADHDAADACAERARSRRARVEVLQRDLRDPAEVADLLGRIGDAEGRLDVLVANAASGVFRSLEEMRPKHWRWVFDVNARSFLLLLQSALPLLERSARARVVAVTSSGARRAIPLYGLLGASKAALEALVRQAALELAQRGIAVNGVCPGLVETSSLARFLSPEQIAEARKRTPAGRLVTPEDVAGVVSFLCGPDAGMIHGQILAVDGGYEIVA